MKSVSRIVYMEVARQLHMQAWSQCGSEPGIQVQVGIRSHTSNNPWFRVGLPILLRLKRGYL
jgi:hypothetical protein